jgi:uncharacterized protein (DUF2249 family)
MPERLKHRVIAGAMDTFGKGEALEVIRLHTHVQDELG